VQLFACQLVLLSVLLIVLLIVLLLQLGAR
jgi:hypothetical protein